MGKKKRNQQNPPPPTPVPAPPVAPATAPPVEPAERSFFTREDWIAAAVTFLISGSVFLYFMSPSVTLQDSGELVTGAYNFGVPHPPGYPLWAFLGWVWSTIVPLGNPAYRICLMSVLTGATLTGIMTLLMTRSILTMLRASPWADRVEEPLKHWIALTVGPFAALMFAFNRGVWLWACVPEMRVLNVFMFVITACFFFAWMMRPERHAFMYATILVYTLGITNHQTVVVMAIPLLAGAFVVGWWLQSQPGRRDLSGFCEMLASFCVGWVVGVTINAWLLTPPGGELFAQKLKLGILAGPDVMAGEAIFLALGATIVLLVLGGMLKWLNLRRAAICTGLFLLGTSFYFYMPVAASTNPPMNWGFTATRQGFLHHITRGQYERLNIASPLSHDFYIQIKLFVGALLQQFSPRLGFEYDFVLGAPFLLFGLATIAFLAVGWKRLLPRGRVWLIFVWTSFVIASIGLIMIINPQLEKQQQEINIKFFAPAHGFFVMLIGYGIALTIAAALARWPNLPRTALRVATGALLLLPVIPLHRNYLICEQRGHDFGYQFGYRMFYPGGSYAPMDKDAVLYGGTDPGRFVPTYMILAESRARPENRFQDSHLDPEGGKNFDRRDVYIITQNALADNTYMNYIRDHYDFSRPDPNNPATLEKFEPWQRAVFRTGWHTLGRDTTYPREPIYIPNDTDLQKAFQEYVADVQRRQAAGQPLGPDENVEIVGGSVQVRGVGGVMAINAILTKWIFERNKDKHSFYVEESYPIPWMFPYLEPAGIIMKINKEPLPPPDQAPELWATLVQRDRAYWDKLCADFTIRPEFARDSDAQKTFSKLRSAIGGIYSFRKMYNEAIYSFQQALRLCPDSPEANFRLTQIYMELGQFDNAVNLLTSWQRQDPLNKKITDALAQVQNVRQTNQQIQALESQHAADPRNVALVMQLAQAYARVGQGGRVPQLLEAFLAQPGVPANDILLIAQAYLGVGQVDRAIATIQLGIERNPNDSGSWYALALLRSSQGATDDALQALDRALQITPSLRDQARNDQRFGLLRNQPRFLQLVTPSPTS